MENQPSLRRDASRLGLSFLAFVLAANGVQIVLGIVLGILFPAFAESTASIWLLSYVPLYGVGLPVLMLTLRSLAAGGSAKPGAEPFSAGMFLRFLLFCLGAAYLCNFLSMLVSALFILATGRPMPNPVAEIAAQSDPLSTFLFVCVLPPIGEEFICRKLIWNHIGAYGTRVYVFCSALIFGLIHGNFSQLFYAFALGAAFAYIYARTGRLIYTIALHFCINLIGTIIAPAVVLALAPAGTLVLGIFVIVCIAAAVILWLRREFWMFPSQSEPPHLVREALTAPGILAFTGVCFALSVVSLFA